MYDSEHGMDICISQHMKFKMKQSRHNNSWSCLSIAELVDTELGSGEDISG